MPIIKSAKKRVRVARKATVRNVKTKRTLRTALKAFHTAVTSGKKTAVSHAQVQSALDKAVKKGVVHKNKAARKQKQLAAQAKAAAGVKKPAGTKSAAPKKAAAKKPAVKKATATKKAATKKPVAKKAPAKKPAAKKTTKK
jgi:ribosomal protein S20